MKKIIQFLIAFLDAIVGVEEPHYNKAYPSIYEAQEQYKAGLITCEEDNETFKCKNGI
jgi:hypothetical protein